MKKLQIGNPDILNATLNKLQPMWKDCFNANFLQRAQIAKSKERNIAFGILMNEKFIVLKKDKSLTTPPLYSISDIYEVETASNLAGLLIYRLNRGDLMQHKPRTYVAE